MRRPPAGGLGDPPKMILNLHFSSITARALALTSLEVHSNPDLDLSQPPRTGWVPCLLSPRPTPPLPSGTWPLPLKAFGRLPTHRMILTNSLMLTWSGTRNLVLSRTGSCFSPL